MIRIPGSARVPTELQHEHGPFVFPPHAVTSARHLTSWVLLAFTAGSINTGAFLTCDRFVSHVTGIVARIGMDVGTWPLMLDYAIVLACFIAGATLAAALVHSRRSGDRAWIALLLVVVVIASVAALGQLGILGAFASSTAESRGDFVMLSVFAFAMGLQNASAALRSGMAVRSTHMTGPSTDLGIGLGRLMTGGGDRRKEIISGVILRSLKLVGFAVGAGATVVVAHRVGFGVFWMPAVAAATATLLSFVPAKTQTQVRGLEAVERVDEEVGAAMSLPPAF